MADRITLEVTRYRPEQEAEPTTQRYEAPLRKDWVVLDALNYIKDKVDGSLSFRWSCRMGVCGSCGMNVNGTPKLTCATFLTDYAPGPIRVEPMTIDELASKLQITANAVRAQIAPMERDGLVQRVATRGTARRN